MHLQKTWIHSTQLESLAITPNLGFLLIKSSEQKNLERKGSRQENFFWPLELKVKGAESVYVCLDA